MLGACAAVERAADLLLGGEDRGVGELPGVHEVAVGDPVVMTFLPSASRLHKFSAANRIEAAALAGRSAWWWGGRHAE